MALPPQAEVQAAFLRFRDQHDAEALALVFDRTAQGLLLVAGHLAGPGVDAEDLVQATFVQAIRNADRYDARRPLEPWLLGILANEAHAARRQAARRIDPARLPEKAVEDPQARAEEREHLLQLRRNIEALPAPMRDVMALYLVHGMTPTEIAHALGRPAGTVKSWVHRGLERLRVTMALNLAVVAATPMPSARLTAMREIVVQHGRARPLVHASASAGEPVVGGDAATIGRGLAGRVATFGALVMVPWLAWLALGRAPASPPADAATTLAAAPAMAAAQPVSDGQDDAASRTATPSGSPTAELWLVAHWHDGTPAAIGATFEPRFAPDPRLHRHECATDSSGTCRVTGLSPGTFDLALDRGTALAVDLQPGVNRIEVTVPAGIAVRGTVFDSEGRPLAGADIRLATGPRRDDGRTIARSAADGSYAVRDVPAGAALAAFADGWVPTRYATVRSGTAPAAGAIASPASVCDLRFELKAGDLSIRAVDANGSPIVGALVQIGSSDGPSSAIAPDDCRAPPPWLGHTDSSGVARCRQVRKAPRVAAFMRAADAAGAGRWLLVEDAAAEVTLVAPRSRSMRGSITDMAPGARVEVGVADIAPSLVRPAWLRPQTLAAPEGEWHLEGVSCDEVVLEARGNAGFALTERPADTASGDPWLVRLGNGGRVEGTLRGADGSLLSGYRVGVHALGFHHAAELTPEGRFAIDGLGDLDYEAVVLEPGLENSGAVLRRTGVRPGMQLDLVVPEAALPTASVRGLLLGADGAPLTVAHIADSSASRTQRSVACSGDGEFVFEGLPAGNFVLYGGDYPYPIIRTLTLQRGEVADLGNVTGTELSRCRVTIAADRQREGIEARLVLGGGNTGIIDFARLVYPKTSLELQAPAGSYDLVVHQGVDLVHQQTVELAAGSTVECALPPTPPCRLEVGLRFRAPCGWSVIRCVVTGRGFARQYSVGPRPPGDRWARTLNFAAPPGSYRIAATSDVGPGATADVELTASTPRVSVLLELR